MLTHPASNSRAQTHEARRGAKGNQFSVAHAHGSPILLLRVCLRSKLRREPRRWLGVFLYFTGKANSVSPVPARIALQGGERADADAICPCPCKKRAIPGTCLAGQPRLTMGIGTAKCCPAGLSIRFRRQDTQTEALLRNFLTIARNPGGVNDFRPSRAFSSRFRSKAA
jgi:hypothetical protein